MWVTLHLFLLKTDWSFDARYLQTSPRQNLPILASWNGCTMARALLREPGSGVKACQPRCALACHLSPRVLQLIRGVQTLSFHYCSIVLLYPDPNQRTHNTYARTHKWESKSKDRTKPHFALSVLSLSFPLSTPVIHQNPLAWRFFPLCRPLPAAKFNNYI